MAHQPRAGCIHLVLSIGFDFLFITFRLHVFPSLTSSLSISCSAISTSKFSDHVFHGHTPCLLPSTLIYIQFFTQSSSFYFSTCPYHLSLPLMKVVICSTPTSFHGNAYSHLIICISVLSNCNPTSASKGLV